MNDEKLGLKGLLAMDLKGSTHFGEHGVNTNYNKERIASVMDKMRERIAFYRAYPDYFIDDMKGPDSKFEFLFYQRIMLRVMCRYRYCYITLPRAGAKSFLAIMSMMIRCVLYPGTTMFVTTGGKDQSALTIGVL